MDYWRLLAFKYGERVDNLQRVPDGRRLVKWASCPAQTIKQQIARRQLKDEEMSRVLRELIDEFRRDADL